MLAMNAGRAPFDDVEVRRAVFRVLKPLEYALGAVMGEEAMVGAGVPVVEGVLAAGARRRWRGSSRGDRRGMFLEGRWRCWWGISATSRLSWGGGWNRR